MNVMKRNKLIIVIYLLICLSFLIACNKNNEKTLSTEGNNVNYIYDEHIKSIAEGNSLVSSENGYYFIANGILYFYDIYNDITLPVCSKVDCSHKGKLCDAYAEDTSTYRINNIHYTDGDTNCLSCKLWYDNGKIYMIKRDAAGAYLIQYDRDYTNEIKLCTLASDGGQIGLASSNISGRIRMYNGYMYYFSFDKFSAPDVAGNDYTIPIRCNRIKIEKDAQPEVLGVFEFPMDYEMALPYAGSIIVSNDGVYFMAGGNQRILSKNSKDVRIKIFRYDIEDKSFETIIDKKSDTEVDFLGKDTGSFLHGVNGVSCVDDENNIYIVTNECDIVKLSSDGTVKKIYEGYKTPANVSIEKLIWDGEYLYFVEPQKGKAVLKRMDKSGNITGIYDIEKVKTEGEEAKSYLSIILLAVDKQNIIISPKFSVEVKGLEAPEYAEYVVKNIEENLNRISIGIIPKEAFEDNSIPIKKIYEFKSE